MTSSSLMKRRLTSKFYRSNKSLIYYQYYNSNIRDKIKTILSNNTLPIKAQKLIELINNKNFP